MRFVRLVLLASVPNVDFALFARNHYLNNRSILPAFGVQGSSLRRLKDGFYQHGYDGEGNRTMKLYVVNLSFKTTEADLREKFEQFGTVNQVDIIIDRESGRSKGFAFIEMNDRDEANAAIQEMNGATIGDRTLAVNEAHLREECSC